MKDLIPSGKDVLKGFVLFLISMAIYRFMPAKVKAIVSGASAAPSQPQA